MQYCCSEKRELDTVASSYFCAQFVSPSQLYIRPFRVSPGKNNIGQKFYRTIVCLLYNCEIGIAQTVPLHGVIS